MPQSQFVRSITHTLTEEFAAIPEISLASINVYISPLLYVCSQCLALYLHYYCICTIQIPTTLSLKKSLKYIDSLSEHLKYV